MTTASTSTVVARAVDLVKQYGSQGNTVRALDGVSVSFTRGEFAAIMGPSGSGKSTLMHLLAGLDTATSGQVLLGETDLTQLSDRQLTLLRRSRVGFVFQAFNLLPMLTARQNITLPLKLGARRPDPAWFEQVTGTLGLSDRLDHRPSELSGGQQQRVAMARALITRPDVIFADEPTGALDSRTSVEMLAFLRRCVRDFDQTVVMVTHDPTAAAAADRVVLLNDGRRAGELYGATREEVLDAMGSLADSTGAAA